MLDVRRMRTLQQVALRGSIAAAAQELSFTSSAVSQQILKLEQDLGIALVERGPRSVRLTAAGQLLVDRTDEVLVALRAIEDEVRAAAARDAGSVRIAAFPTVGTTIVADAISELSDSEPPITAFLSEVDPERSVALLRMAEIDVLIGTEYDYVPLAPMAGMERLHLLDDPVLVLLSADHALADCAAAALRQLARERWITSTNRSFARAFTRNACRAAGFEPCIVAESDDHRTVQRLVGAGFGISLTTDLTLTDLLPGVVAVPIAARPLKRRIFAATLHRGVRPSIERVLDALRRAADGFVRSRLAGVKRERP